MAPNDQMALIARSKCYLQLGEPDKALGDAETALGIDKNSIRAIYQKAVSFSKQFHCAFINLAVNISSGSSVLLRKV